VALDEAGVLEGFEAAPAGVLRQAHGFRQIALRLRGVALQGAQQGTVYLI
jgi:hypothetical protein